MDKEQIIHFGWLKSNSLIHQYETISIVARTSMHEKERLTEVINPD